MSKIKEKSSSDGNNPKDKSEMSQNTHPTQKYSDFVKKGSFGSKEPEKTEIFQSRLFAPSSSLKINEVAKYVCKFNAFGLERLGKDLIVSFRKKENRDSFNGKIHTIGKIKIEVGIFPPQPKEKEALGAKHFLNIPMDITGIGFKKTIDHFKPTRFIFEKFKDTNLRTGRAIFWSKEVGIPSFIFINEKKIKIKKEKEVKKQPPQQQSQQSQKPQQPPQQSPQQSQPQQSQKSQQPPQPQPQQSQQPQPQQPQPPMTPTHQAIRDHGNLASGQTQQVKRKTSPLSKPSPPKAPKHDLDMEAPFIDASIFEELGVEPPNNHCVLSIYEGLKNEQEFIDIRNDVTSPIGKTNKREITLEKENGNGTDRFMFSVQLDRDDHSLWQIEGSYTQEAYRQYFFKQNWVQRFSYNTHIVLVLFKSRIFKHRLTWQQ